MSLLSRATVAAVGLTCKAVFSLRFATVTVHGLPTLLAALADDKSQGVVTVSNHISTLDDPVTWGVLPARCFFSSRTTRWALGASDIMFTNPIFSTFFRLGQTLETFRGKGVHQPAVDTAISKLDQGNWVHLYGEGKVNQPATYSKNDDGVARLPRFKWGVGRILMEASAPPMVIPMWLTGFDKLMPEGRAFPYKYFPRPGAQLSVTFGTPIPADEINKALGIIGTAKVPRLTSPEDRYPKPTGWMGDQIKQKLNQDLHDTETSRTQEILKIRAAVTAIIQREVESLGRSVCGDSLSHSITDTTNHSAP